MEISKNGILGSLTARWSKYVQKFSVIRMQQQFRPKIMVNFDENDVLIKRKKQNHLQDKSDFRIIVIRDTTLH